MLKAEEIIKKISSYKNILVFGSDHGGYEYKKKLIKYMTKKGFSQIRLNDKIDIISETNPDNLIIDIGTFSLDSVDYPDYAFIASKLVVELEKEKNVKGILICGTGIGISIAANKVKGVRAAVAYTVDIARLSREHNDANIICFGERYMDYDMVQYALDIFLKTNFEGGRHKKRIEKIGNY